MRKALTYTAGLIALYLVVEHYTGAGTLLTKGSQGGVGIVKALQGR
jgi:hypothetical protein